MLRPAASLPKQARILEMAHYLAWPAAGALRSRYDGGKRPGLALNVRYRHGGERIKPAGDPHTRELRLLLQEAGMPPWQRAEVPLIYAANELIAVGDLFLSNTARELFAGANASIVWTRSESAG